MFKCWPFCRWSLLVMHRVMEKCVKSAYFCGQPVVTFRLSGLLPKTKVKLSIGFNKHCSMRSFGEMEEPLYTSLN